MELRRVSAGLVRAAGTQSALVATHAAVGPSRRKAHTPHRFAIIGAGFTGLAGGVRVREQSSIAVLRRVGRITPIRERPCAGSN